MAKISDYADTNAGEGSRKQAKYWINFLVPNQSGEYVSQSFLQGTPCDSWKDVVKVANKLPLLGAAMKAKGLSTQVELAPGEVLRFKVSAHLGIELRAVGSTEATLNDNDMEVELL